MKMSKLIKLKNVLELIEQSSIEDINIETIDDILYISSTDIEILTVLNNLVDFNVADDYMSGKDRIIKISINL